MFEGTSKAAGGDTNMVFGHNLPVLWAYKLRRWGSFGQLHRLYYPIFSTYTHLQKSLCQTGKKKKKKKYFFMHPHLPVIPFWQWPFFHLGKAVCFRYLFWWASCNYLDPLSGHSLPHSTAAVPTKKRERERVLQVYKSI
jgi:hypothetical protein